jgi:pimeloyl-ACP methyl ester carboxylesterase
MKRQKGGDQMKALSVKLGVILIGLCIFGYAEVWGVEQKVYVTTDAGYIFHPRLSNDRALVYCRGGFGKLSDPYLPDANYFVNHGWTVFFLKYEEDRGKPKSIKGDIKTTLKAILSLREKFRSVDLLGVSRGGFVALQTFVRYKDKIDKCVAVVAPVHIELWEQVSKKPLEEEYFKGMDDPYEYVGKMPLADRLELGKKLLLIYGTQDDIVPASQGIRFSEMTKSKLIQVNGDHMLFYIKQENQRLVKEFFLK